MRALAGLFAGALVVFFGRRFLDRQEQKTAPQQAFFTSRDPAPSKPSVRPGRLTVAEARAIIEDINTKVFAGWFTVSHVLAIIDIESNFDPRALNPEDGLDFSFGLMQIRESSARDRGFINSVEGLFSPRANIGLGMAHLKWSWDFLASRDASPSVPQWISSYNAGVGNTLKGFINTSYVRKWQIAKGKYE